MTPAYIEPKQHLLDLFRQAVAKVAPAAELDLELTRPKQAAHGDWACNAAMQLARGLRRNPREVAAELVAALPASVWVDKVEIAGPGFINVFLKPALWQRLPAHILTLGAEYGRLNLGRGERVQVEFVSANPTGPLHVGHGRGAAFGASLANVLAYAGYDVTREYYVNDAGRQMDILALSTWLRYLELIGERVPFPPNAYQGEYVRAMAKSIYTLHADRYRRTVAEIMSGVPPVPSAEEYVLRPDAKAAAEAALDALIATAKRLLGQDYDYFHGYALGRTTRRLPQRPGRVRRDLRPLVLRAQPARGPASSTAPWSGSPPAATSTSRDGALWFRSSAFGDEKDRVVRRENGAIHLFRRRHRLPPEQVRARFRTRDRRLGRRSPRLHRAREGGARRARPRTRSPRGGPGAVRRALSQRPEGLHVHPCGRIRHPAGTEARGGQ
jgi:arginyl-tRNA synthetase